MLEWYVKAAEQGVMSRKNLDGINKAIELIEGKSPEGEQKLEITQIIGRDRALANMTDTNGKRSLVCLIHDNVSGKSAVGEVVSFDKLFWALTYTYETKDESMKTVPQLASDYSSAIYQVREALGLYDETDPVMGSGE